MTTAGTLSIDSQRCTGHGRCYSVAPKLLSDDEDGFVALTGSMDIAGDQVADAEEAAAACPERALTFTRTA